MVREPIALEIITPDVTEAVVRAQTELGVGSDQLRVEVLEEGEPVSGLPARVRISLQDSEASAHDSDIDIVLQVVSDLLSHIGVEADISIGQGESVDIELGPPILVDIHGEDLSILIGRRGARLDALQFIVRAIVARTLGRRANLFVDVAGYNMIREQQLQRLANRIADQVVQQGRPIELEPMSPRERRVVHIALEGYPQVVTASSGEGDQRRVTISPHS